MEKHQCFICGELFDTGSLLFHKNLRNISPQKAITGTGECPKCVDRKKEDFIALIGVTPKGEPNNKEHLREGDVVRTGDLIWIKKEAYLRIVNRELPEHGVAYIDYGVVKRLQELAEKAE